MHRCLLRHSHLSSSWEIPHVWPGRGGRVEGRRVEGRRVEGRRVEGRKQERVCMEEGGRVFVMWLSCGGGCSHVGEGSSTICLVEKAFHLSVDTRQPSTWQITNIGSSGRDPDWPFHRGHLVNQSCPGRSGTLAPPSIPHWHTSGGDVHCTLWGREINHTLNWPYISYIPKNSFRDMLKCHSYYHYHHAENWQDLIIQGAGEPGYETRASSALGVKVNKLTEHKCIWTHPKSYWKVLEVNKEIISDTHPLRSSMVITPSPVLSSLWKAFAIISLRDLLMGGWRAEDSVTVDKSHNTHT